jgi:NAD-dependent dihydropyrimidine dehydrogenase PreA subunit
VITSSCLDTTDQACVDVCPVQCIYVLEGDQLVSRVSQDINPEECTSCDACMPECPVDAIYPAEQVPEGERDLVDINRYIFADITA